MRPGRLPENDPREREARRKLRIPSVMLDRVEGDEPPSPKPDKAHQPRRWELRR